MKKSIIMLLSSLLICKVTMAVENDCITRGGNPFSDDLFGKYILPGSTCNGIFHDNNSKIVNDSIYNVQWACTSCIATYPRDYAGGKCTNGTKRDYYILDLGGSQAITLRISDIIQSKPLPSGIIISSVSHGTCNEHGQWEDDQ